MGKKHICFAILFLIITCFVKNTAAYNDTITHPDITERAAKPANSQLDQYLKSNLGFEAGLETQFTLNNKNKPIIKWLREGAELEDDPICRATNHFHNPLPPLTWAQSFLSDDTTFLGSRIRNYCESEGWAYANRKSNVTWATGYLAPPPDGTKEPFNIHPDFAPINWDKAREYYYNALTATLEESRETYFALTFKAAGHVMHLLEDVSVPAHSRNDFTSHLTFNGFLEAILAWDYKKIVKQPYEYYVEKNPTLVTDAQPDFPSFTNIKLTDFWDTEQYTGSNPSTSSSLGLSEFTNANYFSDETIPNNDPSTEHTFPYPQVNSTNTEICEDYTPGSTDIRKYISRKDRGVCPPLTEARTADHFATPSLLNEEYMITNDNISSLKLWLDDNVHDTYAKELLSRAVGYSAGLLDYFFRGTLEISLPNSGVYATDDTGTGFTSITLLAENITPDAEEMTDGSIKLVVKYRLALEDPFMDYPPDYPFQAEEEFSYIVVPASGTPSIPRNTTVELTFDLSQNPLPLYAIDVYLQVVYKGKLGMEDNAVAVGFKDISEPTPVDLFSNTDKICLYDNWYDAGSPEAIDLVDANDDGIADEWDVYLHDQKYIYIRFSPFNNPRNASATEYNFYVPYLTAGNLLRALYILTDAQFNYSFYDLYAIKDPDDINRLHLYSTRLYGGTAIKNQTDYVEDTILCDGAPSCYIWFYSRFETIRDIDMWWGTGLKYINSPYPEGSACSYDLL